MKANGILVVCWDNLGDLVLATAVIEPLVKAFPGIRLGFWSKSYTREILGGNPYLKDIFAADPFWLGAPGRSTGSFLNFIQCWYRVRQAKFLSILLLNSDWRRAFWLGNLGARKVFAFSRKGSQFFLGGGLPYHFVPSRHILEEHRLLLQAVLGADPGKLFPRLFLTSQQENFANDFFREKGLADKPVAVIHPFSGNSQKCWPLRHYAQLADWLRQVKDFRVILFSSPAEAGQERELVRMMHSSPVATVGRTSPGEMSALIKRANLFVGGDSGPLHIAAAWGIPWLALFGPTSPQRYAPLVGGKVLHRADLAGIPVSEVTDALEEFFVRT